MKFTDLTLINLILAIAIFILVLGLASYSLNVHEKLTEIFEEDSFDEDENVIVPVPVEEASEDSILDRMRSWYEENEETVNYSLIGLGIVLLVLLLIGLLFLIYFCLRNYKMDVEMLIITKKGKWIYIDKEVNEPEEDIGCLEKSRRWIVGVYEKIVEKLSGKKSVEKKPDEEKQKQKNNKEIRSGSEKNAGDNASVKKEPNSVSDDDMNSRIIWLWKNI